jgi:hypothetical protein
MFTNIRSVSISASFQRIFFAVHRQIVAPLKLIDFRMFQVEINTKKHVDVENPLSVDEIEPRLFLGNVTAATNLIFLKSKNISHILTIDSFPIPNFVKSSLNG